MMASFPLYSCVSSVRINNRLQQAPKLHKSWTKGSRDTMKLAFTLSQPPQGGGGLPPIILLHGRLDSRKTWIRIAPVLAEKTGRNVYALDMRNHGESDWSPDISFDILAADLDEFMVDLGIARAILVGHSLGGKAVILQALNHPEKVEKVVVEDMVTTSYSSVAKTATGFALTLLRDCLEVIPEAADEATAKRTAVEFLMDNLPPSDTKLKETKLFDADTIPLKRDGGRWLWQANLDVLEAMLKSDGGASPNAGVYDGDALFLYGTESYFQVGKDESIYTFFPKAKKVPVEGSGHLIHHCRPEEFVDHVLKFIHSSDNKL